MKKIIYFLIITLLMTSCLVTHYQGFYLVELIEVERPQNVKERYGDSKIISFNEEGITKYSFEDDMIKVVWLPLARNFSLAVENKTEHSIKIIWDEAVYVNEFGFSSKLIHSGTNYSNRYGPQTPTVIVKGGKIIDTISPADKIKFDKSYSRWYEESLFKYYARSREELDVTIQNNVGKTVKILIPLQIEETINEYIFSFVVSDFVDKSGEQFFIPK